MKIYGTNLNKRISVSNATAVVYQVINIISEMHIL